MNYESFRFIVFLDWGTVLGEVPKRLHRKAPIKREGAHALNLHQILGLIDCNPNLKQMLKLCEYASQVDGQSALYICHDR